MQSKLLLNKVEQLESAVGDYQVSLGMNRGYTNLYKYKIKYRIINYENIS